MLPHRHALPPFNRPFRAVHLRDLVGLSLDMAGFEQVKPELTPEWIDAARAAYFMDRDSSDAASARISAPGGSVIRVTPVREDLC